LRFGLVWATSFCSVKNWLALASRNGSLSFREVSEHTDGPILSVSRLTRLTAHHE
jgi:hypothetical protein